MKFRFLTFSIMLLFAACSFGTTTLTAEEPRRQMAAIYEILEKEGEDDDD